MRKKCTTKRTFSAGGWQNRRKACRQAFLNALSIVAVYSTCTRALTFGSKVTF